MKEAGSPRTLATCGKANYNAISPSATDMIGQQTAFVKPNLIKASVPQVRMGNDLAEATKCGPGGSRTVYRSGFQALTGKPSPGEGKIGPNAGKDILSEYGPDKSKG